MGMNDNEFDTSMATPKLNAKINTHKRQSIFFLCIGMALIVLIVRIAILAAAPQRCGRWRTVIIPALRGRILDANGVALAWSTRSFSINYAPPESRMLLWRDLRELEDSCGLNAKDMVILINDGKQDVVTLCEDVSPELIAKFQIFLRGHCRFSLKKFFVRHHATILDERLIDYLGKTRQSGWHEVGVSGLEKELNDSLLGVDGKIRVLVDEDGQWISGTECRVRKRRAGFDRYVDFSVTR